MIKIIKSLCQNLQRSKVYVDATIDHIEMADDYLILGVNLEWHNETAEVIAVREVQLRVFSQGQKNEPTTFHFQGHFARIPNQRVIQKMAGEKSFLVRAEKSHTEYIRFYTRDLLDLKEGIYPMEIHATVPTGTYVHQANIQITKRLKYRTSEAWTPIAA